VLALGNLCRQTRRNEINNQPEDNGMLRIGSFSARCWAIV